MPTPLYRTGVSSLTDNELILLDVMFDGLVSFAILRRDGFAEAFNCEPHNLDDAQLRATIDRFCRDGILCESEPGSEHPRYELTARGGELWEAERTPVWERYAMHRWGHRAETPGGNWLASIAAGSRDICEDYPRVGCDARLFPSPASRVRHFRLRNWALVPWKPLPMRHAAVCVGRVRPGPAGCNHYVSINWSLYDSRRTWWSSVAELQKFVGPGA